MLCIILVFGLLVDKIMSQKFNITMLGKCAVHFKATSLDPIQSILATQLSREIAKEYMVSTQYTFNGTRPKKVAYFPEPCSVHVFMDTSKDLKGVVLSYFYFIERPYSALYCKSRASVVFISPNAYIKLNTNVGQDIKSTLMRIFILKTSFPRIKNLNSKFTPQKWFLYCPFCKYRAKYQSIGYSAINKTNILTFKSKWLPIYATEPTNFIGVDEMICGSFHVKIYAKFMKCTFKDVLTVTRYRLLNITLLKKIQFPMITMNEVHICGHKLQFDFDFGELKNADYRQDPCELQIFEGHYHKLIFCQPAKDVFGKRAQGFMVWLSPFSNIVWISLIIVMICMVITLKLHYLCNRSASNWFHAALSIFGIALRQSSYKLALSLFMYEIGMSIIQTGYETLITSRLIVPLPGEYFQDSLELIDANYTITYLGKGNASIKSHNVGSGKVWIAQWNQPSSAALRMLKKELKVPLVKYLDQKLFQYYTNVYKSFRNLGLNTTIPFEGELIKKYLMDKNRKVAFYDESYPQSSFVLDSLKSFRNKDFTCSSITPRMKG